MANSLSLSGRKTSAADRLAGVDQAILSGVAALAITLQIQASIDVGGTATRISLSDIVALGLAPIAGYLLLTRMREVGRGLGAGLILLFLSTAIVMGYALAIGIVRLGGLQSWPLLKFAGWLALLLYALIGTLYSHAMPRRAALVFAAAYLATMTLFLVVQTGYFMLAGEWFGNHAYRYAGFLGNPNAQGFAMLCGFAICLAAVKRAKTRRVGALSQALAGFVGAGIVQTGSLAAFVATIVVLLAYMAIQRPKALTLVLIVCYAAVFFVLPQIGRAGLAGTFERSGLSDIRDKVVWVREPNPEAPGLREASLMARIENYKEALALWLDAPVFGSGLGFHLAANQERATEDRPAQQIHNTGLWILTEMGAVGFFVFAALYVVLLLRFWRTYRSTPGGDPQATGVLLAVLLVMAGWLVMSLVHELLYQRVLWVAIGLAMGVSRNHVTDRREAIRRRSANRAI